MGTAPAALQRLSRFQVLTGTEPAWASDGSGTLYLFDGFYFSRRRRRDAAFLLVPSWQTPPHGWLIVAEDACPGPTVLPQKSPPRPSVSSSPFAA